MASKKFTITQKVNLNNKVESRSFAMVADTAEMTAFIGNLEGKITVKEITLEQGSSETVVSTANFVKNIIMSGSNEQGRQSAVIGSYDKRALIFKNTASADDIRATLTSVKPFGLLPNETPKVIAVNTVERVAVATV